MEEKNKSPYLTAIELEEKSLKEEDKSPFDEEYLDNIENVALESPEFEGIRMQIFKSGYVVIRDDAVGEDAGGDPSAVRDLCLWFLGITKKSKRKEED